MLRPIKNRSYLKRRYIHMEDFLIDAIKYNEQFLDELSEYNIHDRMIPRIVEIIENYRAKLKNPKLQI